MNERKAFIEEKWQEVLNNLQFKLVEGTEERIMKSHYTLSDEKKWLEAKISNNNELYDELEKWRNDI